MRTHPCLMILGVLLCWLGLGAPVAAAQIAYGVRVEPSPYEPLPHASAEPLVSPEWTQMLGTTVRSIEGFGSAQIDFPFPIRYFGGTYTSGAAWPGALTFGSRVETLCDERVAATRPMCAGNFAANFPGAVGAGPIPRDNLLPSRVLALWWGELDCDHIVHQTLGELPRRSFVLQYSCTYGRPVANPVSMQLWFHEGSSSIEVRYGPGADPLPSAVEHFYVGVMDPQPDGTVAGYVGLPCSRLGSSCGWGAYPLGEAITYYVPADAALVSVETDPVAVWGMPVQVRTTVENRGDQLAQGLGMRFFLSRTTRIENDAVELGDLEERFDLAPGESRQHELSLELPADLPAGSYRILAWADPAGVIAGEVNTANNLLASAPFLFGPASPFLRAAGLEVSEEELRPGALFVPELRVRNEGPAQALQIPYALVLSQDEEITVGDRLLFLGELSVSGLSETVEHPEVELPGDVAPGSYRLGLLLDPLRTLSPLTKGEDVFATEPIWVGTSVVEIVTRALPAGELGETYCVLLEAAGGRGSYEWSVGAASDLPPGLALVELPAGAREAGEPFATRLCGRPSRLGSTTFTLEARSGTSSASWTYQLEVVEGLLRLSIATGELPAGAFLEAYELALVASGGRAPYVWRLASEGLPQGLALRRDGTISGIPQEGGRFTFSVEVIDMMGARVERALTLLIIAPSRLRCSSHSLPPLAVGEEYLETLGSGGGVPPHLWQTVETRRLASEIGEEASTSLGAPPPGLSLSVLGEIGGAPSQAGRYLWIVAVSDSAPIPAMDECILVVDVLADHGLTVTSGNLPPATAGFPYKIQLAASGGEGALSWQLFDGNQLPEGLRLSAGGLIEGSVARGALEGRSERTFPFLVEVRDELQRRGLAALAITVSAEPPAVPRRELAQQGGGCGVGGAGLAPWALVLVLGGLRRRSLAGPQQGRRGAGAPLAAFAAILLLGSCGGEGDPSPMNPCETSCPAGTSCDAETGQCACVRSPDSCAPLGLICNSVGQCIEPFENGGEQPFQPCSRLGALSEDQSLRCHGPLANGGHRWAPICETSADCEDPSTVCFAERSGGELPICWYNFCGDDEVERDAQGRPVLGGGGELHRLNGESWGPCDTWAGRISGDRGATGTCLPTFTTDGILHLCQASGRLDQGAVCNDRSPRVESALCGQGMGCRVIQPRVTLCMEDYECEETLWCNRPPCEPTPQKPDCPPSICKPRPCRSADDCGIGNFCEQGLCLKAGSCEGFCDGLGGSDGTFASCDRENLPEGSSCTGDVPADTSTLDAVVAYCEVGLCDVFDSSACGDEAVCESKPSPLGPFAGSCVSTAGKRVIRVGARCEPKDICEGGSVCRRIPGTGGTVPTCVSLCDCEGEGGWDETYQCKTTAVQCAAGKACVQLIPGNERLGACL